MSLSCTATFCKLFQWSLLLAFSLKLSSSSAFLRSLFKQSSHLSCGLPHFLQPSCFFVSNIFGNLSSFILTMCPAHFIRLLTTLPAVQAALVPIYSPRSFILLLSTIKPAHKDINHFPNYILEALDVKQCIYLVITYLDMLRTNLKI